VNETEGILTLLAKGFGVVRNDLEEGNRNKGMKIKFKNLFHYTTKCSSLDEKKV
jgi:hypothetical protein